LGSKLGEILMATPKAAVRMNGKNFDGTKKEPSKKDAPTLEQLGLSKKESAKRRLHMAWLHPRLHPYSATDPGACLLASKVTHAADFSALRGLNLCVARATLALVSESSPVALPCTEGFDS
jgi:hypothetical protein